MSIRNAIKLLGLTPAQFAEMAANRIKEMKRDMLYLYLEGDEADILSEPILYKSKDINKLIYIVTENKLTGWTIGDEPVNYEDKDYTEL